jgi:hypothetical protein
LPEPRPVSGGSIENRSQQTAHKLNPCAQTRFVRFLCSLIHQAHTAHKPPFSVNLCAKNLPICLNHNHLV